MKNVILTLTVLSLLTGCAGQSSNPLKDRKELKGTPEKPAENPNQKIGYSPFSISVKKEDINKPDFFAGQSGQMLIEVSPKTDEITNYKFELISFTRNEKPTLEKTESGMWALNWSAPATAVPSGHANYKDKATVRATVVGGPLEGQSTEHIIIIETSADNSTPRIVAISKPTGVQEDGPAIPVTIEVIDPASAKMAGTPFIHIPDYQYLNKESFSANGRRYIDRDDSKPPLRDPKNPEKWTFYYMIRVKDLSDARNRMGNVDSNASSVNVCTRIQVESVNGQKSTAEEPCYTANFAAQAPVIQMENANATDVKAGEPAVIKFSVLTPNGLGKVDVKFSGLSGKRDLKCTPESAEKLHNQRCELTWTPICQTTERTEKLTLSATSNFANQKPKAAPNLTKEFKVTLNESACKKPTTPKGAK